MRCADGVRCKRSALSGDSLFPSATPWLPPSSSEEGFAQHRRGAQILPVVALGVNAIACHGYNPSVFSACKTSRKASSPCTGEPRTALRQRSSRLLLGAHRSRALSLPQSYCLNPERSPTAPSSERAKAAAAARHRFSLRGSRGRSRGCRRFRGYDRLRRSALIRHGAVPKAQHRATFPKGKAKRSARLGAAKFFRRY